MILSCSHVSKAFGSSEIIRRASFHIEDHEKAAIVGINGAGKSTLLKIIIGELPADEGEVVVSKGRTLGYLAQHQDLLSGRGIYDELLEVKRPVLDMEGRIRQMELDMKHAEGQELEDMLSSYSRLTHEFELQNGYAVQSEVTGVLKGLGFTEDEFEKPIHALSGGQKTRVSLGKLLLSKPDILLLDEPTNHLDMDSIAWLETYLLGYGGSVVIVAHDRYFLDRVVTKIIELDGGNLSVYQGNYTAYSQKRAMIREAKLKAYLNQQQEIRHQEEVITKLKSFNREKSIRRAESREKMLEKLERVEKPSEVNDEMAIRLEPDILSGNDVLTIRGLSKSFGPSPLFQDVDMDIKRGERVAIIGSNGTGKTTVLKIINGLLPADSGQIQLGSKVHIGYYDQEHQVLHMEKTIFDELQDTYPKMNNTQIRNILAAFLFTGDDVFKRIKDLSGGERGRVSLAKLMLSEANFLILDEPTNHLDITSKEILENALVHYTGTILYVSHDRYFINKTATRILDLTARTLVSYIGNYDYYLEKKDTMTSLLTPPGSYAPGGTTAPGNLYAPGGSYASDSPAASGRPFAPGSTTAPGGRPSAPGYSYASGSPSALGYSAAPGSPSAPGSSYASGSPAALGRPSAPGYSAAPGSTSAPGSSYASGSPAAPGSPSAPGSSYAAPAAAPGRPAFSNAVSSKEPSPSGVKLDWKAQKEEQARQRKLQNDLKKTEDAIHRLETRDHEIDELLTQESVYTDVARLLELNNEKQSIQAQLEPLFEVWESLADETGLE